MNKTRAFILLATVSLGVFFTIGGSLVMAGGVPYESCTTSYTGAWGIIGVLMGLIILILAALAAWDSAS